MFNASRTTFNDERNGVGLLVQKIPFKDLSSSGGIRTFLTVVKRMIIPDIALVGLMRF